MFTNRKVRRKEGKIMSFSTVNMGYRSQAPSFSQNEATDKKEAQLALTKLQQLIGRTPTQQERMMLALTKINVENGTQKTETVYTNAFHLARKELGMIKT